jgi:hypothetical protein
MFFNKRKRYNGDVSALLPAFGIDLRDAGVMKVLNVLDIAWEKEYNQYEGALLVAYSYAAGLYKINPQAADKLVNERLYDIQRDWIGKGIVNAKLVEKWPQMLKARAESVQSVHSGTGVNLPQMKPGSGSIVGRAILGENLCLFFKDAESVGPIKYLYMLVVTEGTSSKASVIITLESNAMQRKLLEVAAEHDEELRKGLAELGGMAMLCMHTKAGDHVVLEPAESSMTFEQFRSRSLAIAANHLGVSIA